MTLWAVAVVALGVAGGSLFAAQSPPARPSPALTLSGPARATSRHPRPVVRRRSLPSVAHSRPVRLNIGQLGISTGVGSLGLQANGQVMVPRSVHTVGWYRNGPTPGEVGSSVILGHVDSYIGPGIFFELKTLHVGASITVVLADGVTTRFAVTRVVEYSKGSFPDRLVYGPHGTRSLNLVTCGGVFNHATGSYESNIVVFSRLVAVEPRVA